MIVLGIESTAHTFGASVVDDSKKGTEAVLSNVRVMATTEKGGMIPSKVADHHEAVFDDVIFRSLSEARVSLKDVNLISVSKAPGLGHALRIGVAIARVLAMRYNKPLVGVNHCIAHLEIAGLVTEAKDPILLYCSGANTQVIAFEGGKYRVFGETLDMGVGNFIDSFARSLGLGFPGGPKVEILARKYNGPLLMMPYSVKGMDVAFSGILTHTSRRSESPEALAFSVQETVFAMLVEVAERALAHTGKQELVLGGGVACNKRLQEMARTMCEDRGAVCFVPDNQFLVDNAAMIAWTGSLMFRAGVHDDPVSLAMDPYERTDEVTVTWR